MLLCPTEDPLNDQLHPGDLGGNRFAGDQIVALPHLADKGIALFQHLPYPGISAFIQFGFLLFRRSLALPFFQSFPALLIFLIGLIAGDQQGLFVVHMPLDEQPFPDHLLDLPADETHRFSGVLRQGLQGAVGLFSQGSAVDLKPLQPAHSLGTVADEPYTGAQPSQRSQGYTHGIENQRTYQQGKGDQRKQASAHSLQHRKGLLAAGTAVQDRQLLFRAVRYFPGRFAAHIHRPVDDLADGLIQFLVVPGIDRPVHHILDPFSKIIPILTVIRHKNPLQILLLPL